MSQSNGALQAATYYGSTAYDQAHFVRVNNVGNVFIFGQTRASGNTLIYNAPFNRPNSGQFLASFSNDLQTLNGLPYLEPVMEDQIFHQQLLKLIFVTEYI
jgi:hypothetical protein